MRRPTAAAAVYSAPMQNTVALAIALSILGCGGKKDAAVDPGTLAGACDNVEKAKQCTEWYGYPSGYPAKHCGQENGGIPGGKAVASCPKEKALKKCVITSDAAHPRHEYYYEGLEMKTITDLCSGNGQALVAP